MATIKVQMDEKRAVEVRRVAMQVYGHKKGAISTAVNNAIDQWLLALKTTPKKNKKPVDWNKLIGIIKDEKMSSVEYQHYITKELWPTMVD